MQNDFTLPADVRCKVARTLGGARLLLVEPDAAMAALVRFVLRGHGFADPHVAEEAEEALDLMGALAQALDAVLVAYGATGTVDPEFYAVLRRVRSPVRAVAYGAVAAVEMRRPEELVGIAAYVDLAGYYGLARHLRDVLAGGDTVGAILATSRVPRTLSRGTARAIYAALPGERFDARRVLHS